MVLGENEQLTLLERFHADWAPFWGRVEALDAATLRRGADDDSWPIGLILAHCARWEDWNYETITNHLRDGSAPSMTGFAQWNEQWASVDRSVPPDEARRWLGDAHERLRTLLDGLRADQWDELVSRCVEACTFHHYGEHIDDLPA